MTEIPEELLLHMPATLAPDEEVAWLAAARLLQVQRQATTALAVVAIRYAEQDDLLPMEAAQLLWRRWYGEAAVRAAGPDDDAGQADAEALARTQADVAYQLREALADADALAFALEMGTEET